MTPVAIALLWLAIILPAYSRGQSNIGLAETLPPESCVPPPLGRDELLTAARNDGGLQWNSEISAALKSAKAQHQQVLLYFRTKDCMDCDRMQAEIMADTYIQTRLRSFVLVRINREAEAAKKYGVTAVPALVRLSPEGVVAKKHSGPLDKDSLLEFLRHEPK